MGIEELAALIGAVVYAESSRRRASLGTIRLFSSDFNNPIRAPSCLRADVDIELAGADIELVDANEELVNLRPTRLPRSQNGVVFANACEVVVGGCEVAVGECEVVVRCVREGGADAVTRELRIQRRGIRGKVDPDTGDG